MNAKKRLPGDPHDNPTRKVESMSSMAAELLLQSQERRFEEETGKRMRSTPPPAYGPSPEPWRASAPPPVYGTSPEAWRASAPPLSAPKQTARVGLLALAAVLLVVLSVAATLLVTR
jgi:hypothetical protein